MRQWRVGTVSMAIILIAVGIIMIVSQASGVSAAEEIIRWWPLILIILGAEILGYIYFSKEEQPKIKFDAFSIFLVLVILLFSLGAYTVTSLFSDKNMFNIASSMGLYKYESSFKKNFVIEVSKKDSLLIANHYGALDIVKSPDNKIHIEANITIRNNDENYAKTISDDLIDIIHDNPIELVTKTNLYNNYNNGKINSISVNYYIKVPETITVNINNSYGNVNVSDTLKNVKINNK